MAGFLLFHIFLTLFLISPSISYTSKPECQTNCGGVEIPYPFGIGPNCALSKDFELNCTYSTDDGSYKPFVYNIEVTDITLPLGQARMKNEISWQCYNSTAKNITQGNNWHFNFVGTPFRFSNTQNTFTVIGIETLAYIILQNSNDFWYYYLGCVSRAFSMEGIVNGSCSGIGCCQTAIPPGMNYYDVSFDKNFNNSDVYNLSACSYAVLMEANQFKFATSYVTTSAFLDQNNGEVPMVMDWAIGDNNCTEAQKNKSSYACISDNSICVNSSNGPGYLCNCAKGYEGNPYLSDGCKDTDECLNKTAYCAPTANCTNKLGTFECFCPPGTHGNPNITGECYKTATTNSLTVKLVIGITVGLMVTLILSCLMYFIHERRKVAIMKKKCFQQYGGHLLYQEMKSKQGFAFTILNEEELKEATDNFDPKNVLGEGGNGTVYRGTLKNCDNVAIKKCKTIDERQKKEFGKEILILSQINHKNIVRILGCCLEVEIPILVYEFVPNGNLFDLIHLQRAKHISLNIRLRIAQEAAEALAYLHSWASPPIVHRDVKSSNILLGDNLMAKVSDFGASVLAPTDEDQFLTLVQGTRGYLDPEYMQTGQLTVKSDVYSFGVVLLELLTRKKAFFLDGSEEKCLSSAFLSAMKENKLEEILDDQIMNEESMNLINGVADLAKECLNMEGEKRPEMKEIAETLDRLRKTMNHPWAQDNQDEIQSLLGEPSSSNQLEMTSYHSLEEKAMLAMAGR